LFNDHDKSSIKQIQVGETSAKEIQDRRYRDLVLDYQQLKLKLQGTDDVVVTLIARNAELSQDRAATDESDAVLKNECSELLKMRKQLENDRNAYLLEMTKLTKEKAVMHAEMKKSIETLDCVCREQAALVNRIDKLSKELEQVTNCYDQNREERKRAYGTTTSAAG
jgi:hypothetical protein